MLKITRGWPPERRRKQAENIRRTKPWLKTTGPKTVRGKQASKKNAYKHGWRSADIREVYRLLRTQRRFVKIMLERHVKKSAPGLNGGGNDGKYAEISAPSPAVISLCTPWALWCKKIE